MVTKVTIVSGFLGAGKTTYLRKILPYLNGNIAIIENEFGKVGIDGELLKGNVPIKEIFAGCICCSVAGDLKEAITDLVNNNEPDHIIIEPSGVGSLSEIIKVIDLISKKGNQSVKIHNLITIVDASAFDEYLEDFGMFYKDQIRYAHTVLLSHTENLDYMRILEVSEKVKEINPTGKIITNDWISIDGDTLAEITGSNFNQGYNIDTTIETVPAEKIFGAVSIKPVIAISRLHLENILINLKNCKNGRVLRAKGIVDLDDGSQLMFNFTPFDIRFEEVKDYLEPKTVVIGARIDKSEILEMFSI